jgi:hypothetical protein
VFEQGNGQPAGQMVVARPGLAHGLVAWTGAHAQMPDASGDRDQSFNGGSDVGVCQAKVVRPALLACDHQARLFQLA